MSCRERSDLELWTYLDNAVPDGERRRLDDHVAECAACQARLAEMRERPLPLGPLPMVAPPADLHARIMARVIAEAQRTLARAQLGWLAPLTSSGRLAAAATLSLALALVSAAVVGAALVAPALEAAATPGAPASLNMLAAMRQALVPLRPFFAQWGWGVVVLGMLATLLVPGVQALALRVYGARR